MDGPGEPVGWVSITFMKKMPTMPCSIKYGEKKIITKETEGTHMFILDC